MTVYVVACLPAYEDGGEIFGVYSSRAAAENSWHMKYEKYNEIQEFELDLDPNAEVGDPGVWHGPQTKSQHELSQMFNEAFKNILAASTPWKTPKLPLNTGKTIQFFHTEAK